MCNEENRQNPMKARYFLPPAILNQGHSPPPSFQSQKDALTINRNTFVKIIEWRNLSKGLFGAYHNDNK